MWITLVILRKREKVTGRRCGEDLEGNTLLGMAGSRGFEGSRERLIRAFPPQPFCGLVSTHAECDEGVALRQELAGKCWDEVPAEFVDFNSGSLPLLEANALIAFLPAWLLRSMETLGDESVLSEFTMYFLCPGTEDEGRDQKTMAKNVSLFDAAQRDIVCDYLRSIAEREDLRYWHPYVERGLKWWCA